MRLFKYIFLAMLLCGFSTAIAQSLPTKQEQFDFLRWYIKYRRLVPSRDTTISFSNEFATTTDLNTILSATKQSKLGRKHIKKQVYLLKHGLTLDTTTLQKLQWDVKATGKGSFISTMSFPVFSVDRKLVIIQYGYYCGNECGREGTDVFIKNKYNKWVSAKIPTAVIVF